MVSHAVAGVLHVQIVLSHWSMHSYEGRAYTGPDDEWYITTMRTTMNVATHPLLDWMHIGLQFQIEHHLFPRVSRCHLRDVSKHVSAVCGELGLDYHSVSFYEANREVLANLKHCGSCGAH